MVRHGAKFNVKGFTLVELMVVVAIIALLATISTPNLFGFLKRTKARDGANAVASYLQNARDQAMSRGEVVLLGVTVAGGNIEIATYRAPLVETVDEFTQAGTVQRDRFASSCSELTDPLLANPYAGANRVAVLNPQTAGGNGEVAERLDPNIRVVGMTDPAASPPSVGSALGSPSPLLLCFAPDGRVYTSDGAELTSQDGVCNSSLVFIVTSDPNVGVTPTTAQALGETSLQNWVCPTTTPVNVAERKRLYTTLDVARDSSFVYAVSMSFNGRVRVD